jgi:hypothetical protein
LLLGSRDIAGEVGIAAGIQSVLSETRCNSIVDSWGGWQFKGASAYVSWLASDSCDVSVPASIKDLESQYFARKDMESYTFDQNGFGQLTYISVGIPMISVDDNGLKLKGTGYI